MESSEPKVWLPGEGWVAVQQYQDSQQGGHTAGSEGQAEEESSAGSGGVQADAEVRWH